MTDEDGYFNISLNCLSFDFDYIARESVKGIAEISRSSNIPIINGIITTDNAKQAEDRSQVGGRNKGWDAVEAALQTIDVYQEIFLASKC